MLNEFNMNGKNVVNFKHERTLQHLIALRTDIYPCSLKLNDYFYQLTERYYVKSLRQD